MSEHLETGTHSFLDRFALARRLEENLEAFLHEYGLHIIPFGQSALLSKNTWLMSRLKKLDSKESLASIMVKFSPDYIVYKETQKRALFFSDAKVSITPVFFGSQIDRIRRHSGQMGLLRSHIGEIEREAWFSYNTFYPPNEVAIVMACPYSNKLLLAEWAENIRCLWCYKKTTENGPVSWNCSSCKEKKREGFGVIVNEAAGGSGTPHTNIDFRTMRTLDTFLKEEFGINVDKDLYNATMLDFIKTWPLNKPNRVTWGQLNGAIRELQVEGCTWLKFRFKDKLFIKYDQYREYYSKNSLSDCCAGLLNIKRNS